MPRSRFTKRYAALREILVKMRKDAGLTQRELAKRIGREQNFVARLEIGDRRIDVVELLWLCQACGVDPVKFFRDLAKKLVAVED